jgi:Cu(I)/Ag(I) efflux system membrane fusion protein
VRLVFDNREQLLRPDMFAQVSIKSNTVDNAVVIPAEANIRSGSRTQVFLVRGPGKFEPRIVKLGFESNGQVAVLEGVNVGDEVVTSAQFLVDSESKLREATAKMMDALKGSNDSTKSMDVNQENDEMTDHSNMKMNEHTDMDMDMDMKDEAREVHVHD